jgi:hypothetical protein
VIFIDEQVLFGILKDQDNPNMATNHNDESGRYRMPILRQWESDGDVPTYDGKPMVRMGDVWVTQETAAMLEEVA